MAKNITLMGANYPDVPAVDLPKTGGGTARFIDEDSVMGSAVSVTKENAQSIDIVARKAGDVINVSGYAQLNSGTYTDQMPIFTLGEHPTSNIYFFDNLGNIMRIKGDGSAIFHSGFSTAGAFIFFNFGFIK